MNDVFETCSQAALVQRNMGQMQVVRRTCACRRDVPKGLMQKRMGTLAMGGGHPGSPHVLPEDVGALLGLVGLQHPGGMSPDLGGCAGRA